MINLLGNEFVSRLNSLRAHIPDEPKAVVPAAVPAQVTGDLVFDILDKSANYFLPLGMGSVTYHNTPRYEITAVNYEEFINSLPENLTKNLRRPDFIVYDPGDYIIINELSQGKPVSKRSDAKYQMANAVKALTDVPEIKSWIDMRPNRLCIFSCRASFPDTPQGIADAFGLNGKNLPQKIAIKFQPITKSGFEAFETDVIVLS